MATKNMGKLLSNNDNIEIVLLDKLLIEYTETTFKDDVSLIKCREYKNKILLIDIDLINYFLDTNVLIENINWLMKMLDIEVWYGLYNFSL